ncbi:tumor necrosis factor receptor superfamily member 6-like [Embiotoca jacksoni]|uniref:tumor necrosis factor receptor superfamily member 6-like n=1 Tax=Embiotoca jacksoni TaxID=100190 RepID=UPI003703B102
MATGSTKFSARVIVAVLFFLHVLLPAFCASTQPKGLLKILRYKRQDCADGTYEHEGRTCCLCAPGQRLENHCINNRADGKCELCEDGRTYNSQANSQETCLPCTSCSQLNAGLEVDEPCTTARNTKCRCQKNHYSSNDTQKAEICHRCKTCGSAGHKEICTATSDTVCNDESNEVDNSVGKAVGIAIGVIVAVTLVVFLVFWRKIRQRWERSQDPSKTDGNGADEEMLPLADPHMNLLPHLPDIVNVLTWKDVQGIALRSEMTVATIDSCKEDHPGNTYEQKLKLLKMWMEMQGRDAPMKLIKKLQQSKNKEAAQKVRDILSPGNTGNPA